ncbi:MAG: hypothetical protein CM15mP102_10870 [Flavobacteriales bacterium]|nr:MAG: hypothetical protein CM15mP102_10870 [Flavobacteriales bacterium]
MGFLSSPNNLELITPKSMDFNITDWDEKKAYPGQTFSILSNLYLELKLLGLLEITQVKDKEFLLMSKDLDHILSGITNTSSVKLMEVF